jgi:hypothetical protein
LSRDDEDRWIERTVADPEFADAVWSGQAPVDDAPEWYPRVLRILEAAHHRPPPDEDDVAVRHEAWTELSRRLHRRQWRRRLIVVGAVAVGAALVAGGAAAAMSGGFDDLPAPRAEAEEDGVPRGDDPVEVNADSMVGRADVPATVGGRGAATEGASREGGRASRAQPPILGCLPEPDPSPGCSGDRSTRGGEDAPAGPVAGFSGGERSSARRAGAPPASAGRPNAAGEARRTDRPDGVDRRGASAGAATSGEVRGERPSSRRRPATSPGATASPRR